MNNAKWRYQKVTEPNENSNVRSFTWNKDVNGETFALGKTTNQIALSLSASH